MTILFKYLICFDFEVTCWEKSDPENAEIIGNFTLTIWFIHLNDSIAPLRQHYIDWKFFFILFFKEIAAVLLNLKSGTIESEFHRYVKPAWDPSLSEYCRNLTGISQELINRQSSFRIVCKAFIDWLKQISIVKQLHYCTSPDPQNVQYNCCTAAFCSWNNCNLKQYFRMDCERNTIEWPIELKAWVDARKIFQVNFFINLSLTKKLNMN